MATKIKSIQELKTIAENKTIECFISLAGGLARSSKTIRYNPKMKTFYILNEIDDTRQRLKEEDLDPKKEKTNIGLAIKRKALFLY